MKQIVDALERYLESLPGKGATRRYYSSGTGFSSSELRDLESEFKLLIPPELEAIYSVIRGVDGLTPDERSAKLLGGYSLYNPRIALARCVSEIESGEVDLFPVDRLAFMGDWAGGDFFVLRGRENSPVYKQDYEGGIDTLQVFDSVLAMLKTGLKCIEHGVDPTLAVGGSAMAGVAASENPNSIYWSRFQ